MDGSAHSLAKICPHQTLIVISHRISSLTWVDRFALLDQGLLAAVGAHSVLYAQSALYRTLFDVSVQDMSMSLKSRREDQVKDTASSEHQLGAPL
jgi:ABC-type transport system involved in cytochrome bd biosynthesis fused ATPase/permease subunit